MSPHFFNLLSRRAFVAGAISLSLGPIASAHEMKSGDLVIQHPWSRATVPAAKVAGGYLTIVNKGSAPDKLLSATAEIAPKTEIHRMTMDNGVMTMRAVEGGIEVPAGGQVALEPGDGGAGYHLMFMAIKTPLKEGETFKGALTFEKAGVIEVEFKVESMAKKPDHNQHGG